jgi:BCD family chlorophyll transporter-like MFS transporter
MFLVGMGVSAVIIGWLLREFSRELRADPGGAGLRRSATIVAERRSRSGSRKSVRPMSQGGTGGSRAPASRTPGPITPSGGTGRTAAGGGRCSGTLGFNMQDVLLEPYGGEILGLSVSSTTLLTATWAAGALIGFAFAARWLSEGMNPYRMGARGILMRGIAAFSAVIFANAAGDRRAVLRRRRADRPSAAGCSLSPR